jgi:hypothetical protein
MSELRIYRIEPNNQPDFLHVKKVGKDSKFHFELNIVQYQDKQTNQFVVYVPCLDITGYGENLKKADEMAHFSIQEYFDYLSSLSVKKLETELRNLGWKHDAIKNKDYSKAYIDVTGTLKDFAVEDTLKVSVLTAA